MYKKYSLISVLFVASLYCFFTFASEKPAADTNKSKSFFHTWGREQAQGAIDEIEERFLPTRQQLEDFGTKTLKVVEEINETLGDVSKKYVSILGVVMFAAYVTSWSVEYTAPILAKMIQRRLIRPELITEFLKNDANSFVSIFNSSKQSLPVPMVFSSALERQLDDLIKITSTIHDEIKRGEVTIKYRNLMLSGPSGTGKTKFAKELARQAGLDYASISGLSFSKFKEEQTAEALDDLFIWAKRNKGLMIFIDEAELFLSKRENMDHDSKAYHIVNNFLNHTKERSSDYMFVFATHQEDKLDSALYNCVDDLIEMPLPLKDERIATLNLYKNKIFMNNKKNKAYSFEQHVNGQVIEQIADKTKGFSHRDLEGIMNSFKINASVIDPVAVNADFINNIVDRAVKKHTAFIGDKHVDIVEN